jgi:predicted GNAT family acetyltransferase
MTVIRDNAAESRYELLDGDDVGVIAEYRRGEQAITFTHTETLTGHEGKGLAKQLVTAALDEARATGLAVLPECPYVRKVIAENPAAYLDLVPLDARARFDLPAG